MSTLSAGFALRARNNLCPEHAQYVDLDATTETMLNRAVQQLQLSARAYRRVLKLARTIADLEGGESVQANHVAEALQYRPRVAVA